jgi:alkanesulfonate monooxygenase SsuD/methylene tetrahydromethanopterin reductase-like flavin-dependent oxidoreductase (luciferase family)
MFHSAISFDMRAPAFGTPASHLYGAALDMLEYADKHGIDQVVFPEHHGSEDGYNPIPALMGAATAARTSRIAIVLGAIVLPLHDPVKVAETIAVMDLLCGGRLHTVLAAGYVESEFKAFRRSLHDRARSMDRALAIIIRALNGERFMDGDREVFVRPLPLSRPPKLYVGGGVASSARRAVKFGLRFWPLKDDMIPVYEAECRKHGRDPEPVLRTSVGVHVANDPEAAWAQIGPHVLHLIQSYASWAGSGEQSSSPFTGITTVEAARRSGVVAVVTPDQCVELARRRPVSLMPLVAGLDPKVGWESLELFVNQALPRIRALPDQGVAAGGA